MGMKWGPGRATWLELELKSVMELESGWSGSDLRWCGRARAKVWRRARASATARRRVGLSSEVRLQPACSRLAEQLEDSEPGRA